MEHEAAVAEEGADAVNGRGELVEVGRRVGIAAVEFNLAVLASEIAYLAGLGNGRVARGHLAALIWVEVSQSGSAVAVVGDRLIVNVVDFEVG